jgi:pyruvate formate lyase activating enzyme
VNIGGYLPFSTVDYPGEICSVVFLQGCLWKCSYCHNPELLDPNKKTTITSNDYLNFLKTRTNKLDAVVFSGGEPCLQGDMIPLAKQIKDLGFKLGLHTNGAFPSRIMAILPFFDWIGIDYKCLFKDYKDLTKVVSASESVRQSIQLVVDSGVSYEVRTTIIPGYHTDETILLGVQELVNLNVRHYRIQGDINEKLCQEISSIFETFEKRI